MPRAMVEGHVVPMVTFVDMQEGQPVRALGDRVHTQSAQIIIHDLCDKNSFIKTVLFLEFGAL